MIYDFKSFRYFSSLFSPHFLCHTFPYLCPIFQCFFLTFHQNAIFPLHSLAAAVSAVSAVLRLVADSLPLPLLRFGESHLPHFRNKVAQLQLLTAYVCCNFVFSNFRNSFGALCSLAAFSLLWLLVSQQLFRLHCEFLTCDLLTRCLLQIHFHSCSCCRCWSNSRRTSP